MLQTLARQTVRLFPPETAHSLTIRALSSGLTVPRRAPEITRDPRLARTLPVSGLTLGNPVGLAAGFDKNAEVHAAMLRYGFGFVECGTVTPQPQAGNPKPRLFRLSQDAAVINRMGFNNDGLDRFVARLSDRNPELGVVGANVGANKTSDDRIADYVAGLSAVWTHADYITLNISSPNTPGLRGLQAKDELQALLARAGAAAATLTTSHPRPVFLKVAPDLDPTAIGDIADIALAAPYLQGLIVSNTTLARPDTLASRHKGEAGGLSGKPLMTASTEILRAFAGHLGGKLDLIGVGGIGSADDARAKMEAGAQAVQLYSALVYRGPELVSEICSGLLES